MFNSELELNETNNKIGRYEDLADKADDEASNHSPANIKSRSVSP